MSRAFIKDQDDAPEPVIESHSAGMPVSVTAAGRAKLEEQLATTESPSERNRLEHLVPDLVVVEAPDDRSVVAFGATVDVRGETIGARRFTVVGADEADIPAGRVSEISPLGVALLGAHVGDVVTWHRPAGDVALTIESIGYDDAPDGGSKHSQ